MVAVTSILIVASRIKRGVVPFTPFSKGGAKIENEGDGHERTAG